MNPYFLMSRRAKHFLAVFETGNIQRAAESIFISQPALSMSIRQLEEELGMRLFERQARGVIPSKAGQILYRYATTMQQAARLANEEISALSEGTFTTLRLGAGVVWATSILTDILSDLQLQFPGMSIDMITGIGDQLASHFIAGDIDICVASGSLPSLEAPGIEKEFIGKLPASAIADKNSRLAQCESVTPMDLISTSWVGFYEDDGFENLSRHHMALRGLQPPTISMRTNSAEALAALLKDSEHVAILLSPLAQTVCQDNLVELPMSEVLWDMPTNIYYRQVVADIDAIRSFREKVRSKFEAIV